MVFKEIESKASSNKWRAKQINDSIEGEISKIEQGQFGPMYFIMAEDGAELLLPNHKVLVNRLQEGNVVQGDVVRITYLGQLPTNVIGRKPTEMYKVAKDE